MDIKQNNNVDHKKYHEELDIKHLQICEDTGITFERLVELKVLKMKASIAWANWILNKSSTTKLDFLAANKIVGEV